MRYFEPDMKKLVKCGVLTVSGDGRVTKMTEKSPTPATNWCCPPFYFFKKEDAAKVNEAIASGCGTDAPGSFVAYLCEKSTVFSMEMPGKRHDVGNLESYLKIKDGYKGVHNA